MPSLLAAGNYPGLILFTALALVVLVDHVRATTSSELAEDAQQIVERADRVRFPEDAFQVDVKVTTTSPKRNPDVREYRILAKGHDKSIVLTTAPPIDRGQIILMKGSGLWAFLPTVSQPVRLPLSQRLTGQVANGDLARANFSSDYRPEILRSETIDSEKYYVLELIAVNRRVTYHRVLYWVNQTNYRPYKAEFYTLSNRLLKTCQYQDYKKLGGVFRPTRLVMEDTLRSQERSVMEYSKMRERKLSDKVFTKQYLKKLQ